MDTTDALLHYEAALKVSQTLNSHLFDAYIIGGAVRDMLLNRLPKDFDLVTNATPEQITRIFKQSKYNQPAQAYGVTRVKLIIDKRVIEVEVTTYRKDIEAHLGRKATRIEFSTLDDDIDRRDLTINALAFDPITSFLVDYVDGLSDLENGMIRFIGEPAQRIKEDPLRVIRAVRLRNELSFEFDPRTKTTIQQAVDQNAVSQIAIERLQSELSRMLIHHNRHLALEDLDDLGILERILPEVTAGKGVIQPTEFHNEGDVFTHTILTMQFLPKKISLRLAWAVLLHDIGKPPTWSKSDRIRFNDHFSVGAKMAEQILWRFRFPKRMAQEIVWMVDNHLNIDNLANMRKAKQLAMLSHPAFDDLLELHKADANAAWGRRPDGSIDTRPADFSDLEALKQKFKTQQNLPSPSLKRDLGIDGNWLQREYNLPADSNLGQLLDKLQEAYLEGEIQTEQQARLLVIEFLKSNGLVDNSKATNN